MTPLMFVNVVRRITHLQVRSGSDLTGTKIKSDKPLAVFSGSEWTSVGYKQMGDHLVEQMPPTSTWGKLFITASIATRKAGDAFRVLGRSHLSHYLLTYWPIYSFLLTYLLTDVFTYWRTYLHTNVRTYVHAYMRICVLAIEDRSRSQRKHTVHTNAASLCLHELPALVQCTLCHTMEPTRTEHSYNGYDRSLPESRSHGHRVIDIIEICFLLIMDCTLSFVCIY